MNPSRVLPGEPVVHKNYWIPALEIPVFQATLSLYDRAVYGPPDYNSTLASGWEHVVHGPWVVDQDAFAVNQIGHTYQGTMYYGFARSSGLNFWEGWIYSNAGSFIWETYGETTDPSINDQVASGTAGAIVGEELFRLANLVLEGDGEKEKAGLLARAWGRIHFAAYGTQPLDVWRQVFAHCRESSSGHLCIGCEAGGGVNNIAKNEGSATTSRA